MLDPGKKSRPPRVRPTMPSVPPELATSLGLVAHVLFDAAPGGLTLEGLRQRTQLALSRPSRASCVFCEERRHIRRQGERYFAA
jgi:hypothetical protein